MHTDITELRRFILIKQGLLGEHIFSAKAGALEYIRQAGCIQFDPIDICGRNAELTLQSRVKAVKKSDLYELLYRDRALVEFPDKELSIFPAEDWPYLARWRDTARRSAGEFPEVVGHSEKALAFIAEHGPVCADELPIEGAVRWNSAIHWSGNWHGESKASRSVLEQLYSEGRLVIHHREGTRKYYDLAERLVPEEILRTPDPNLDLIDHIKWAILRRIGAVGVLWNRASDCLLGVWGMDNDLRRLAFAELTEEGALTPLEIEGTRKTVYMRSCDAPIMELAQTGEKLKKRLEFIAPLDPLMWDRNLIEAVFGFRYRWEIYVPAAQRKYGYYVLPMIWGDRFVGRVESRADRPANTLRVKNVWTEPGVRVTKELREKLHGAFGRLARFNDCKTVEWETEI